MTYSLKQALLAALLLLLAMGQAQAFTKAIGKGYCSLRHPVESITSKREPCESQHIIQQQSGGKNKLNTIWINTLEHDYLDRSSDAPWENSRPWANWGDQNLERAYMMATYANGYHFFVYNHHGKGKPTLTTWDGMSHLTYLIGSVANFLTKEMSYLGYQWDRGGRDRSTQYIDALIGVILDLVEVVIGVLYGLLGVVVGTVLHPMDTVTNIPGGLALTLESVVMGVINTLEDLLALVSLGLIKF